MATFHFDLVSPERIMFSAEVDQVDVPGAEGDFGVLAGHAPLVAQLRPGLLTVTAGGKQERIVVQGGLAEVSAKGLTVLAEIATALAELDRAALAKQIAEMEAGIAAGEKGPALDRLIERLGHFKSLQTQIGAAAMH